MIRRWTFLLLLGVALVAAPACRQKTDEHETPAGEAHEHEAAAGEEAADAHGEEHADGRTDEHGDEHGEEGPRTLPLEGIRGVAFATVGSPQEEGSWFAGEAIPEESAVAVLSAPVAGIVTALRFSPGATVAAGAVVVELRSPEVGDLRGALVAARARLTRAEAELERERRLFAVAATSSRDMEAAESEAAVARADAEAARLALAARGLDLEATDGTVRVRAGRAGALVSLAVALGEGVEGGAELGRVADRAATRVRVELPLPAPEAWHPGVATEVRASDGRRWPALVEGVPAALDRDTRRLAYRLRLEGEDLPLAGTPVEVRVPLAVAIVLPQAALQQVEGSWGVFVREGEVVRFAAVRRGAELGGDVLVLEGVEPGQIVATEGAYLLRSLYLKLSGGGEAHEH